MPVLCSTYWTRFSNAGQQILDPKGERKLPHLTGLRCLLAAGDLHRFKIHIFCHPHKVSCNFGIVSSAVLAVHTLVAVLLRGDLPAGPGHTNRVSLPALPQIVVKGRDCGRTYYQQLVDVVLWCTWFQTPWLPCSGTIFPCFRRTRARNHF